MTPKQELFVREYLIDLNATQAAIRAGYSEATAEQIGYQMLQKTSVKAAIQAEMDQRAWRTRLTADEVIEGIKRISKKAEADDDYQAALRGHELLGKHLKLFTDKTEMNVTGNVTILTGVPVDD